MIARRMIAGCALALTCVACVGTAPVSDRPGNVDRNYYVYVAAESDDSVQLVRFGPGGGEVVKSISVGAFATEIEGPHGVRVSGDGRHWYVSIAHGFPYGSVFKYVTGDDISIGDAQVGFFPATLDISGSTGLMFVANFNLHGDMEPSTISVIDTVSMFEIAQIEQGIMPHGSRTSPDGRFHYSVGMMDDSLYEIDVMKLEVSRTLQLTAGEVEQHGGNHAMGAVKPTWVEPHPARPFLYVALQGADQIAEVSVDEWRVTRRFDTQKGPYNLAITPDGKLLVATCKLNDSTAIWDLETGTELANVAASRRITHGVAVSSDNRYAFVSVEGVADEPGTVDVIDLNTFEIRASIDVGKQASGIDFWKVE